MEATLNSFAFLIYPMQSYLLNTSPKRRGWLKSDEYTIVRLLPISVWDQNVVENGHDFVSGGIYATLHGHYPQMKRCWPMIYHVCHPRFKWVSHVLIVIHCPRFPRFTTLPRRRFKMHKTLFSHVLKRRYTGIYVWWMSDRSLFGV